MTKITIDIAAAYNAAPSVSERSNWRHGITLSPEGHVSTYTTYGSGQPADVWHGLRLQIGSIPDGVADTSDLRAVIEMLTPDLLALCAVYERIWDGSNHVGRWYDPSIEDGHLDDPTYEISERLADVCDELPRYWAAGDWWVHVADEVIDEAIERGIDVTVENEVQDAVGNGANLDPTDARAELLSMLEHFIERSETGDDETSSQVELAKQRLAEAKA